MLATSLLDGAAYPTTIFKELYHQRWPVEENYKVMKSRIEIENFSKVVKKGIGASEISVLNIYARSQHEVPIIQIDLENEVDVTYGFYDNSEGFVKFQTSMMLNGMTRKDTLYVILNAKDYIGKYQLVPEKKSKRKESEKDRWLYAGLLFFMVVFISMVLAVLQSSTIKVK